MPFPFFPIALAFASGVWLAAQAAWPPAAAVPAVVLPLGAAWVLFARKKDRPARAFLLLSAVALGGAVTSAEDLRFERNPLRSLPAGSYADFYGVLGRSPAPGIDRDSLTLNVSRADAGGREIALSGRIRIAVPRASGSAFRPDILAGDILKISAQIIPPKEYRNFSEPFSKTYLRTQGLHALAASKSPLLVEKMRSGPALSPVRFFSRIRRAFTRRIERYFAAPAEPGGLSEEGAVFEALVLGERGRVGDDVNRTLQETGLLHLLAISGAHIGIISALLFGLLRAVGIPRRPASALLLVILVGYALLVEGQASVTRAVVMAFLYFGGRLLWKDVHLLNTLGLSALIILLDNPFQLFDMGFVLTYAATLSILLFFEPLRVRLPQLPFKAGETLAMSLSAQTGVLPFVASAFHRVTFSGLLLNFLAIPIVSVMLAAGYLFLPLSFLGDGIGRAGAAALRLLTDAFLWSTRLLEGGPPLSYRIPGPPPWVSVGYFAALLLWLAPGRDRAQKAMTAGASALFFLLLVVYPFPSGTRYLKVTFLDVGHGDSILAEFPGSEKMLIDGGGLPVGRFDIGESVVSPFLWSKGIRRLGIIALSHPHPDHRNGLPALARNFRPREFWEAPPPAADAGAGILERALGKAARKLPRPGEKRTIAGVEIEFLAPGPAPPVEPGRENDRSLALRLSYGRVSFLLPGDIEESAERVLLRSGRPLRSTVLKAPHHGSRTSSSAPFLEAVSPEIVVISVGRDNRYGLPDGSVVARYAAAGARVYRTDLHGAVEIVTDGERLAVHTAEVAAGGEGRLPHKGD